MESKVVELEEFSFINNYHTGNTFIVALFDKREMRFDSAIDVIKGAGYFLESLNKERCGVYDKWTYLGDGHFYQDFKDMIETNDVSILESRLKEFGSFEYVSRNCFSIFIDKDFKITLRTYVHLVVPLEMVPYMSQEQAKELISNKLNYLKFGKY